MKNQQTDAGKEKRFWIWRDELGMAGTGAALKVGLSQSAGSLAVSRGEQLVTRNNLQFEK